MVRICCKHIVAFLAVLASLPIVLATDEDSRGFLVRDIPGIDRQIVLSDSIIHPPLFPQLPGFENIKLNAMQCFDDECLRFLTDKGDPEVVVYHDTPIDVDGYMWIYSHTETLPIFFNNKSGIDSITYDDAAAILSGQVKRWSDLGGNGVEIKIFGPKNQLQKKALSKTLSQTGLGISAIDFAGVGDYTFLAQKVNKTEGALAIGLRSKYALPLNLPHANRTWVVTRDNFLAFGTPISFYVKQDSTRAREAASVLFRFVNERAKEDGLSFPLQERLDELANE